MNSSIVTTHTGVAEMAKRNAQVRSGRGEKNEEGRKKKTQLVHNRRFRSTLFYTEKHFIFMHPRIISTTPSPPYNLINLRN